MTIIVLIMVMTCSCHSKPKPPNMPCLKKGIRLYAASGFRIQALDSGRRLLSILNPDDTTQFLAKFILVPKTYHQALKANEIRVPCERIICLSSTQLAYFFELDSIGSIVATNSSRHLFHQGINARIKAGKVKQVGKEGKFNVELIASLNPDLILVSPFKVGGYDAIRNLGVPLVPVAAYKESTPLGRAEWIKMVAPFLGLEARADSIFKTTRDEYLRLTNLTKKVKNRPTVMSGKMSSGSWYVAGGDSFYAHLFHDAGADYIIKDNKKGAYPLGFETFYSLAHNADYWRLLTSGEKGYGYEQLKVEDERYSFFKAYEKRHIIMCNLRQVPYREQSAVKPHILLADYISHFHPQLLPDYTPVYWRKME